MLFDSLLGVAGNSNRKFWLNGKRSRYTQIFEKNSPEVFFTFYFAPGISKIFGWTVRISEIQQFPKFLETFPGNICTICLFFQILESFGWMESAQNI